MNCPSCQAAEKNPHSGLYNMHCDECKCRMVANSPELWEASESGRQTKDYMALMHKMFGDGWREFHPRVKALCEKVLNDRQTNDC